MRSVFSALIAYVVSHFRSHESLRLENMALRHQLAVYQQTVKRPKLRPADRLFWSWLSHLWSDWKEVLAFVQPRTVIAWQKKRFRDYWRQRSQSGTPGRPAIAKEVRDLIQDMWRSNPMWGSPHHPEDKHRPEQHGFFRLGRFGHVGKRDGDGCQSDRVERKEKPQQKADPD